MRNIKSCFLKQCKKILIWFKEVKDKPYFLNIFASVLAILFGIIFGFILLVIMKPLDSLYGLSNLLLSGISSGKKMGEIFYRAMPLIMTGLAVAFAFKTGLFNIGASGQYLMGAFFALYVALVFKMPWWVALLASGIGGAIWGSFPGIFKAYLNVNEVITSIMFNWIGLYGVNFLILNTSQMMAKNNRTVNLNLVNKGGIIPKLGLDKLFNNSSVGIGVIIAIFIAIIIHIVINKTTFGYELKACGYNKSASKYAGINEKRNIILSMAIAGALAGIGGGFYYLNGGAEYFVANSLQPMGFNGIPVALLAQSNPIGVIFSALFIAYIQVGGDAMQPEFSPEFTNIIIAVIIYVSAFSLLFKGILEKKLRKKNNELEAVSLKEAVE